jgi:hypothetical protein
MDCEQARTQISARLDREIGPDEQTALEAHLAQCAECRELAADLALQDADLRRAFATRRQAAEAVAERVIGQLRPATRPSVFRASWLAMLVSAAAGFLLAAVIFRPWQGVPPTTNGKPIGHGSVAHASQKSVAQLAYASGPIEMLRSGEREWTRMQTGEAVDEGTRVRTGPAGRCEFRTLDGSLVRCNDGTELLFQTNRAFELAGGQIWSQVEESEVPFQVRVVREAATVTALGTQFDIASGSTETLLTVIRGSTRVDGKGWQEVVHKGQKATIEHGALKGTAKVRDLVAATTWVDEILKLKGPDNPELAARMNDLLAQIGEGKVTYMHEKEILQLGTHCVLPLTQFIESDRSRSDSFKRLNAARILAKIAQPWSVPDLIQLLGDNDGDVRYYAAKALERLTDGINQGLTPENWHNAPVAARETALKAWQTWWTQNRDQYPKRTD